MGADAKDQEVFSDALLPRQVKPEGNRRQGGECPRPDYPNRLLRANNSTE